MPLLPAGSRGTHDGAARAKRIDGALPADENPERMISTYRLLGPLLRRVAPERAHGIALLALRAGLMPAARRAEDPVLATRVWQRDFPNPIGLAAGFDKDAEAVAPLLDLGFGFVEVGSVTPRPQPGNPRPRVFRLAEDSAVINRLGFNSRGLSFVGGRLARFRRRDGGAGSSIVGVNLGKNRDSSDPAADYAEGAATLARYADYLVINVSSPNTPGLRSLQQRDELTEVLAAVRAALETAPPIVIKVAPDLDEAQQEEIAELALAQSVSGLIVSNTTLSRPEGLKSPHRAEAGGLSGRPLFQLSTAVLARLARLTKGRIPLVGTGGVASGAEAYAKIRSGASLVQLYTGLIYQGPDLVESIKRDLAGLLRRDGFGSVTEAVGADLR